MESDFERQLLEGTYKNSPEFINNKQNLKHIIEYLNRAKVRPQVIDIVLGLLKYFRFPLALCCFKLYHHIDTAPTEQLQSCKERLLEVAAYIKSLISEIGLTRFPEIEFFFKWGNAKKKFKINNVMEIEKEFGKFILELSHLKRELEGLVGSQLRADQKEEKINIFLSKNFADANVFEEASIDHIKNSCSQTICAIQASIDDDKTPKGPQPLKKKDQPMPIEKKVEQIEKPKHSESYKIIHKQSYFSSLAYPSSISSDPSQIIEAPNDSFKNVCCQTFFTKNEIVDQPESLRIEYKYYNFPFHDKQDEVPSKRQKIKRTICGFLNAEGGIIYFGIKELTDSRKRLINGMILSQKSKRNFNLEIMRLMKDILPDIGKKCVIKYVPVKDSSRPNYITGCYVVKVIVDRGNKNQVYSYLQENKNRGYTVQKFSFKTENEVLEINEVQRILKIFKNKLQSPERTFYPTHPQPCPQPQLGKPLYQQDQREDYKNFKSYDKYDQQDNYDRDYRYDKSNKYDRYDRQSNKPYYNNKYDNKYDNRLDKNDKKYERFDKYQKNDRFDWQKQQAEGEFPSLYTNKNEKQNHQPILAALNDSQEFQTWHEQQQYAKRKKYKQKETKQVLFQMQKNDLAITLVREGIRYQKIVPVDGSNKWTFIQLQKASDIAKLIIIRGSMIPVYARISYRSLDKDQVTIMQQIIQQYKNNWKMITRESKGDIIQFSSALNASIFYLKMFQMGLKLQFTPMV